MKEPNITIISCPKCNRASLIVGEDAIDRKTSNEMGRMVAKGCKSETITLTEYRAKGQMDMCFTLCEK